MREIFEEEKERNPKELKRNARKKWLGRQHQEQQRLGHLEFCRVQQGLLLGGLLRTGHVCRSCHTDAFKIQNSPRALSRRKQSNNPVQPGPGQCSQLTGQG